MSNLQVIEELCKICSAQAELIRELACSLSEEAALIHAGAIEWTERQLGELLGKEESL